MSERTAVVVGASAGVGRALAEALASRGTHLVLAATDRRDLEALAGDLALRHGVRAFVQPLDLADPELCYADVCREWERLLGHVNAVLLPVGYVADADDRLPSRELIETTVRVNFTGVLGLIAECARLFERRGRGQVVAFSSIAAAAPRGRNMVYAAAKAGLETYLQALRHYFAGTRVRVQVYALGYVDTALSFGKRLLFPPVAPDRVAARVVRHVRKDVGRVYFPRYWGLVTRLLRLLPWRVYRQLRF
jgi:decaprenylphospho-beta-D-erythro-pentofuranosid-2-ulose 2-reductase